MFQLLSCLPPFLSPRRCRGATPPLPAAAPGESVLAAEEPPPGCGWFDSTYELSRGLLVCEHGDDTAAAALAALPLSDWLQHQLRAWQPGSTGAQA